MKNHWQKLYARLAEADVALNRYLGKTDDTRVGDFVKAWDVIKKRANSIDSMWTLVNKVDVTLPFENDDFADTWQSWREYLVEQHGVVMSSRSERAALKTIREWSQGDPDKAVRYLNYAMSFQYRSFFKLDENNNPQKIDPDAPRF